jgi:hypothetical protein
VAQIDVDKRMEVLDQLIQPKPNLEKIAFQSVFALVQGICQDRDLYMATVLRGSEG